MSRADCTFPVPADTQMALAFVEVLSPRDRIEQDDLAGVFARRPPLPGQPRPPQRGPPVGVALLVDQPHRVPGVGVAGAHQDQGFLGSF